MAILERRVLFFVMGHGLDDGLGGLECIVRDVHILEGLVHPREHAHDVLHVAHLLDLLELVVEIVECELVLGDLLFERPGLLLVELLLGLLHE